MSKTILPSVACCVCRNAAGVVVACAEIVAVVAASVRLMDARGANTVAAAND
jgi:hypothetical protein